MPFWFLDNPQRLADERSAIQRLEESTGWLRGVNWHWESGLCIDAIINVHGYDYPVRLTYPDHFPAVPPTVQPQDSDARWSEHQYLNGVLCLEWGPDTWHPQVFGAQVLESTYRLLDIENPLGSGPKEVAPSRHQLEIGQALRTTVGRFYMGDSVSAVLASLPHNRQGDVTFSLNSRPKSWLALVHDVKFEDGNQCTDLMIPEGMRSDKLYKGIFFRTSLEPEQLRACKEFDQLQAVLQLKDDASRIEQVFNSEDARILGILVLDTINQPHFFLLFKLDSEPISALAFTHIVNLDASVASRIPTHLQNLSGKKIGIVGLGSVGSKIALSLARTGITAFLLVDFDIFLPGNIGRHVLDWRDVGAHKVDALAHQLSYIAPDIQVEVVRLHLTGQESTAALNGVLTRLAKCDLLVDATASAAVFNLLTAVTVDSKKPFLWMEVFAGGIGGMIARSRPNLDPDPHTMRQAYLSTLHNVAESPLSEAEDYAAETSEGRVIVATDADVAIIAGFATKFALDTLANGESSLFPYSLYLLGLAQAWLFEAPFHTLPIATEHLRSESKVDAPSPEIAVEAVKFLAEILSQANDADSSS